MARVHDILDAKGGAVHSLSPGNTVLDALELMARENIGSVVVAEEGRLAGIFTERLYAREVFLKGRASPKTALAEVMKREVITVPPDTTVEACMALMSKNRVRHLPVIADERVAGVVSIGDLMKRIIQDREFDIDYLVEYIGR